MIKRLISQSLLKGIEKAFLFLSTSPDIRQGSKIGLALPYSKSTTAKTKDGRQLTGRNDGDVNSRLRYHIESYVLAFPDI